MPMKKTPIAPDPFGPADLPTRSAADLQLSDLVPQEPISLGSIPLCNCDQLSGDLFSIWRGIFLRDRIICYKDYEGRHRRSDLQRSAQKHLTRGIYNGYMSKKTASTVKKMLTAWIGSVEQYRTKKKKKYDRSLAYITFATVTLAVDQHHTDNEIKRQILTPFIKSLKENYKIKYYFWRAEAQLNGNIHFHLILDRYIHYNDLQQQWNKAADLLHYSSLYYQATGSFQPPSTHIKKLEKGQDLAAYVIKYVCKAPVIEYELNEKGEEIEGSETFVQYIKNKDGEIERQTLRKIGGRIWGCSDELREIKPYTEDITEQLQEAIEKGIKSGEIRSTIEEEYRIYYLNVEQFLERHLPIWKLHYEQHYWKIFQQLYGDRSRNREQTQYEQIKTAA